MADEKKVICVKVTLPDSYGDLYCCAHRLEEFSAVEEFDGSALGECITLTLCEMTQEALDDLPDFYG